MEVLKLVFVVIFVDDDDDNDVFKYANLKKFYSQYSTINELIRTQKP